ncbi:PolC-type DNA polymerase III [Hymenobacter sp. B81]|uniref:PolC-type DNA polymerase III n=1 Tax=Hymenobacter sp. B81 TaxID=3344878 RepID=UPI0037DDB445
MSYHVLHSNLCLDLVGTDKKPCAWKKEYFFRHADGRLAQVTELEHGFVYRSPATYRRDLSTPSTDWLQWRNGQKKMTKGEQPPFKYAELPGQLLELPHGAEPCTQAEYEAVLAKALAAEQKKADDEAKAKAFAALLKTGKLYAADPEAVTLTASAAMPFLSDYTVLDFEFIPKGHVPLELGAVRFVNGVEVDRFSSFIALPEFVTVPGLVTEITGITTASLRNAPPVKAVLQRFRQLAGDSLLVAHNVTADRTVLENTRAALGSYTPLPGPWLCTMNVAKDRGYKGGLADVCARYGINTRGHHGALTDALLCHQVLQALHAERPIEPGWATPDGKKPGRGKKQAAVGTPSLFAAA